MLLKYFYIYTQTENLSLAHLKAFLCPLSVIETIWIVISSKYVNSCEALLLSLG